MERQILTFQELVDRARFIIASISTNLNDFSEGSDILSIVEAFCSLVEFLQLQNEIAFESTDYMKATGENLTRLAKNWGLDKKQAVNASGPVKFIRNTPSNADFYIYAGSQVSTEPDVAGLTYDYTVDEDVLFPSGAVSVYANVTCTVGGIVGNTPSGTITNITSTINGIDSVVNETAFVDGADEETDEQLRARIPIHINGLKAGNEDAIKAAVLAIPGITIAKVQENSPANGEVTVYVSSQSGILTQDQIDAVLLAAESKAAFGIEVNVSTPTVDYITIEFDALLDSYNYTVALVLDQIRTELKKMVETNQYPQLQIDDIILLVRSIQGVKKVKNVKINGIADDYTTVDFSVPRIYDKNSSITINELTA